MCSSNSPEQPEKGERRRERLKGAAQQDGGSPKLDGFRQRLAQGNDGLIRRRIERFAGELVHVGRSEAEDRPRRHEDEDAVGTLLCRDRTCQALVDEGVESPEIASPAPAADEAERGPAAS